MGENKIENMFKAALDSDELCDFIFGKNKYFILDRESNEHWPLGSYKRHIEPFLNSTSRVFPKIFWEQLENRFKISQDKNMFLDLIVAYFTPYYNCNDKELLALRKEKTPAKIISLINEFIDIQRESLKIDKRGTGVQWNSDSGLLGSIIKNLQIISERGGPMFYQSVV